MRIKRFFEELDRTFFKNFRNSIIIIFGWTLWLVERREKTDLKKSLPRQ